MARWKAHCRLLISDNWIVSLDLTAEALFSQICRNRRFLKGWVTSLWAQILSSWGCRPQSVYGPLDRGSFHTKKVCSRNLSTEVEFYWQKQQNRVVCHPLGDLRVTYTRFICHLWLVEKRVVDFLLVLIEHFWLALTVAALWAAIGRNCCVPKGVGHFERKFQGEWGVALQRLLATEN